MISKWMVITMAVALLAVAGIYTGIAGSGGGPGGGTVLVPLSQAEADGVIFMREEEKLARDSYMVLGDLWGVDVFDTIATSEQRHMDAIKKLILKYSLVDPVSDELVIDDFVDEGLQTMFEEQMALGAESVLAALYVGGFIEESDLLDIQALVDATTNSDLISTYESLLCGSRNHLRAFVRNIELKGEAYVAFYLTEDELSAIVDFPVERSCTDSGFGRQKGPRASSTN